MLACAGLGYQTLVSDSALALVQEIAVTRGCGHNEGRRQANKHREQTLEEEDIAPGVNNHARCAPGRDTGQAAAHLSDLQGILLGLDLSTYPVAKSPPNAPAILAAEM